jgi:hypothetical protein
MSKINKKPKIEKNFFYLIKQTKFELFEPTTDHDYELVEKIKRSFIENTISEFIDNLLFIKLDTICKIKFK